MKRSYYIIALSLWISFFVYTFFRTEKTVVNVLSMHLLGNDSFHAIKHWVLDRVQLSTFQIYSLPEALWILSITLVSKRYQITINKIDMPLWLLPLILAFGFELFQFLGWANGRFDVMDLAGAIGFWTIGMMIFPERHPKIPLFQHLNFHAIMCIACYAVVYLAHVMN